MIWTLSATERDSDDLAATAFYVLGFAMSLAENAQARKSRLLALRKRRAGELVEDE